VLKFLGQMPIWSTTTTIPRINKGRISEIRGIGFLPPFCFGAQFLGLDFETPNSSLQVNISAMKTTAVATLLLVAGAQAFTNQPLPVTRESGVVVSMGYVPDGFTAESYKKFKEEEAKKKQKNLGRLGPRGFKSRSMQAFQEAMERGEAEHLLPVFNAEERIKKGELKPEDIPYMQRGGSWDNR
jgi:hypothetical protein